MEQRCQAMRRRRFLLTSLPASVARTLAQSGPLKIGHRQANMAGKPGPEVFDIARQIPGLSGVELQVLFNLKTAVRPILLRRSPRDQVPERPLTDVRGSAESHFYRAVTVWERC